LHRIGQKKEVLNCFILTTNTTLWACLISWPCKAWLGSQALASHSPAKDGHAACLIGLAKLSQAEAFFVFYPLLRRASRSSVFVFDFFHSRLGSGRGGDIGGAAPAAATAASSRPLFFPAVFVDLDGEGFILQVHDVFTRIRLGATLAALGGGALGSTAAADCAGSESGPDLFEMATAAMGGKP
jgi:hypothetical protein